MTCGTKRCGLHCAEEVSLLQVNHDDCQKRPLLAGLLEWTSGRLACRGWKSCQPSPPGRAPATLKAS